jgi:hypothetical protein
MIEIFDLHSHEEISEDLEQLELLHDKILAVQKTLKKMSLNVAGFDPMQLSDMIDDAWADEAEDHLRRLEEAEAYLDPDERKAIDEARADYYCGLGVRTLY